MNGELLRVVDSIHREKAIDPEVILTSIEQALGVAAKKHLDTENVPVVKIDRQTGAITAHDGELAIDPRELGRIAAQTAKHVIIQKIREAERDIVYGEYEGKRHEIVVGQVSRAEGGNLICSLGKVEAVLPRNEQVPGESFRVGERVKAYVLDIGKRGSKITVVLSRSCEEFVRKLFDVEVPEIADGTVVIKGIAREVGYRTKITVASNDPKVDAVGACVGVKGARIRNVVDELNGENIDIIRWSEDPAELIRNSLKPAEIASVEIDPDNRRATVQVTRDHLSQAIGKGGRNVRLASRLTNWEIDILGLEDEEPAEPPAAQVAEQPTAEEPAVTTSEEPPADNPPPAEEGAGESPAGEPTSEETTT